MRIAALIARYLLAVMFLVFGFNGFFHFIPMPMPTGLAGQFMGAVFGSHLYTVIFTLQIVSGLLFLIGRYVPLALVLLGPVLFNILAYHVFMDPQGIGAGLFATILWFLVFYSVRGNFAGIFAAKA
jgi:uncharacterized membrane protein YphA (DoxX/SURF4 family)